MRFRAKNTRDSARGYIQCMKCIGSPRCGRTDGRTDVRTYGRTDGRSRDYYVTAKIFWLDRLPGGSDELGPGLKRRYWRMKNRGVWPS